CAMTTIRTVPWAPAAFGRWYIPLWPLVYLWHYGSNCYVSAFRAGARTRLTAGRVVSKPEWAMRVVFLFLVVATGAAAVTSWLMRPSSDNRLAVVSGVGDGGVARLVVATRGPSSPVQEVVSADPAKPRFFGAALPVDGPERSIPSSTPTSAQAQSAVPGW